MAAALPPFHLAFPVTSLAEAREFKAFKDIGRLFAR